jgi:hypothetical protein
VLTAVVLCEDVCLVVFALEFFRVKVIGPSFVVECDVGIWMGGSAGVWSDRLNVFVVNWYDLEMC